jgi:hypothetical protein
MVKGNTTRVEQGQRRREWGEERRGEERRGEERRGEERRGEERRGEERNTIKFCYDCSVLLWLISTCLIYKLNFILDIGV